jgi:hypothetical protein
LGSFRKNSITTAKPTIAIATTNITVNGKKYRSAAEAAGVGCGVDQEGCGVDVGFGLKRD